MSHAGVIKQLKALVVALAQPDGRMAGTVGHERARGWLVERLADSGLQPYAGPSFDLPYGSDGSRLANILGVLPGSDPALPPLLIAAHYDTAGPFPGADDNAAAIAILLTMVEDLRARRPARGIVFAFFDAEEPPYFLSPVMGSVHFYHHQRIGAIHSALVLDLVGHDVPIQGLEDLLFITGIESDPALPDVVETLGVPSGLRIVPTLNAYVGDLSDHHVFRTQERPYLFFSCGRWAHYHSPTDTPDRLNYAKMAAIRALLLDAVDRIAGTPLEGPFGSADTVSTELRFLKDHFGPLVESMGLPLRGRGDIDLVARALISHFGL